MSDPCSLMKTVWCLFCFFLANALAASNGKKKEQLEKKISSFKVLKLRTDNFNALYGKLEYVSSLLRSAMDDGFLADQEVLNSFVKLYCSILQRIVPGVFSSPKSVTISTFARDFAELDEALNADWPVESSVLLKISQLLYARSHYLGFTISSFPKYKFFQECLIRELNGAEVAELLDFF